MLTPDSSSGPLLIYPGKPKPDIAAYRKESGPFDAVLDEGGRAIFMPVTVASTEPEAFFLICTYQNTIDVFEIRRGRNV